MAILGWVATPPTAAGAVPEWPCVTYAYDALAYHAPEASAVSERGPPTLDERAACDTVDTVSHGSLACPEGLEASSATTNAHRVDLAQAAPATPTTVRHVSLGNGGTASLERSRVAANSGVSLSLKYKDGWGCSADCGG